MACMYCGLPTDGGANHGTSEGCIHALQDETQRLRRDVRAIEARDTARRSDHPVSGLAHNSVKVQKVASSPWR